MPPKSKDDKYTDPELRQEVKEEVQAGDKGGQPGQWSARKAQMMASEYKKRGGGYTTDKKDADPSQKHIQQWNDEEWQTRDGSGTAKQEDGTEKRYLPKKAWENMTEEEKDETEKAKEEGSKSGEQFVANTAKAAEERGKASKAAEKEDEAENEEEGEETKTKGKKSATPKKSTPPKSKATKDSNAAEPDKQDEKPARTGQKRSTRSSGPADEPASSPPSAKKQKTNSSKASPKKNDKSDDKTTSPSKKDDKKSPAKSTLKKTNTNSGNDDGTVGTKHDPAEPPAPAGSADRLPKEGQTVHWKSFAGYIEGEVVEVTGEGKDVRIVLKSSKSGKEAVHKPEACFY